MCDRFFLHIQSNVIMGPWYALSCVDIETVLNYIDITQLLLLDVQFYVDSL